MDKEASEITKLTERISKDPKSKLFVPLAEEYKKAGDIEMAVHVLTEGLKNNPGYVTARSFLGKLLIEQGDLIDAQKEFEEVIKAIPDNLMAQRKLGDLYVLQNKISDALKHYKAVLAINPKDSETAMLIAEAEAGKDIKKHIPVPKTPPVAAAAKGAAPVQPAATTATTPASPAVTAPSSPSRASSPATAGIDAHEEAEEVLVVEPLLPEEVSSGRSAVQASPAGEFDFLAESEPQTAGDADGKGEGDPFGFHEPAFSAGGNEAASAEQTAAEPFPLTEEPAGAFEGLGAALDLEAPFSDSGTAPVEMPPLESTEPFALSDAVPAGQEGPGPVFDVEPFANTGQADFSSAPSDEPIEAFVMDEPLAGVLSAETPEDEPIEAVVLDEPMAAGDAASADAEIIEPGDGPDILTAEVIEEPEKQADDFTTDTLAELYISQGFYEKAIDIYERMLADHPNSAGLKDKLTHVRAMAATGEQEEGAALPVPAEQDAVPPAGADVFVPPAPGFAQPRLDDWELPATKAAPVSTDDTSPLQPARQPKPFDLGFEPREYVPPDAIPRKSGAAERAASPGTAAQVPAEAGQDAAGPKSEDKKETVERLESWLKNIMKEN